MTLTDAAEFTKKAKFYVIVPFVLVFVIWAVVKSFSPAADLPEKYITPDYMCGPLEAFELRSLGVATSDTKFTIETKSGAIPDLPKVVNVFRYIHQPSLTARDDAKQIAKKLGFDEDAISRKSASEYEWRNSSTKQTLVVETGNLNFWLTSDFPDVDTYSSRLPSEENAKTIAMEYLRNNGFLTTDFQDGFQKTYMIDITSSGEFRQAASLSEAKLIRVDFFRQKPLITISLEQEGSEGIGSTVGSQLAEEKTTTITKNNQSVEVKNYTTDVLNDSPIFGNISVYLGGTEDKNARDYKVYKVDYVNWLTEDNPCGTYTLITPEEAVKKVQSGEATLVSLLKNGEDQIIPPETKTVTEMRILDVGIAYLDRSERQDYLQPVYYIEGEAQFDDGKYGTFYYYVPAVKYESIPETAGTPQQTTSTAQ